DDAVVRGGGCGPTVAMGRLPARPARACPSRRAPRNRLLGHVNVDPHPCCLSPPRHQRLLPLPPGRSAMQIRARTRATGRAGGGDQEAATHAARRSCDVDRSDLPPPRSPSPLYRFVLYKTAERLVILLDRPHGAPRAVPFRRDASRRLSSWFRVGKFSRVLG